jgi:hypothetical protein
MTNIRQFEEISQDPEFGWTYCKISYCVVVLQLSTLAQLFINWSWPLELSVNNSPKIIIDRGMEQGDMYISAGT